MRGQHAPEYTARGTAIGLLFAFTPTVGVQMPMVFLLWVLIRFLRPAWEFNMVVALAWTWATNVFTVAPIYYVFLVAGHFMLGRWNKLRDFDVFQQKIDASLASDAGPLQTLWIYMVSLFEQFSVPLWLGCIPWALLLAWIGYRWSLRLVINIRSRREARRTKRLGSSTQT